MQKSSQDHHPGGLSSHQAAVHCQGQITQGRERERESLRGKGGEREGEGKGRGRETEAGRDQAVPQAAAGAPGGGALLGPGSGAACPTDAL